jgi:hypothetical protein
MGRFHRTESAAFPSLNSGATVEVNVGSGGALGFGAPHAAPDLLPIGPRTGQKCRSIRQIEPIEILPGSYDRVDHAYQTLFPFSA